ncbi:hypothetical protein D0869_15317 [Hortaea werneckii]|uniref:Zn(2)-C6 fungal-type domain-containing protein n=3 Tax=Hortaea werneckii TaxID=91943 RepID=A0A3M6VZR7_HORWE|nr:hypothetical protein D0869_15317 [Hortaea werneckii]RMX84777.1 hypothetical protein D0868_15432 [Hortaea werneckii]
METNEDGADSNFAGSGGAHAEQSCVACRRLKRKCSKDLPACSLCTRVGRECEYPSPRSTPDRLHSARPSSSVRNLSVWQTPATGQKASRDHQDTQIRLDSPGQGDGVLLTPADSASSRRPKESKFPSAWYIDSVSSRGMDIGPTTDLTWSDIEGVRVNLTMEDARQIAQHYFRTVHEWFPIVSYMRIHRFLNSSNEVVAADSVAMFVAMHLVSNDTSREHQAETQAVMYRSLKLALLNCEQHGQFTTNYLAALVLTCLYEMAHAIYPAAYFTVGACARTCFSMGIHDKRFATQLGKHADTWTEAEERRRLWWATLILERYINVGFMFRPISTHIIKPNEIIPASDEDWDRGELAVNPLLVMSIEARTNVAPFARTCQAAHLLGRVSQHINDHADPSDVDFHFQEADQLQRAASALLAIVQQEHSETESSLRHRHFSAMALCCSALLALYDVHSCIETEAIDSGGRDKGARMELQQIAIDGFKRVSAVTLDLTEEIQQTMAAQGLDRISPFVMNALYQAAGTYAWYARENGSASHLGALQKIRDVMALLGPRWRVADDYLELLKDTEFEHGGGCTM